MKRRGFSLLELLCVIMLLAIAGMMLILLLRQSLDVERVQSASFDQMLHRNAFADLFRADVAKAEKTLDVWGDFQAGDDVLILQVANDRHVVYRWMGSQLQRESFGGDDDVNQTLPTGHTEVRVVFARTGRLLRLRLIPLHKGGDLPDRTVEIAAALGGDLR
jgi:prepilin-type N-terminal cleavage/methylation domain-containing protein